jgi:hypothetical protein
MMEKYDGLRVYWNGKQLFHKDTRQSLEAPASFGIPSIPFEGELW